MKLPLKDAKLCLSLLDALDMFTLKTSKLSRSFSRGISNINEVRAKARDMWQSDPLYIDRYIATDRTLKSHEVELLKSWKGISRSIFIVLAYHPVGISSRVRDFPIF
jgi:hypothetical protein